MTPERIDPAAYFQAYAEGRSTSEVREEYQRYLQSLHREETPDLDHQILRMVRDRDDRQRFIVIHGGTPSHRAGAVIDRSSGQGFTIIDRTVGPVLPARAAGESLVRQLQSASGEQVRVGRSRTEEEE